MLFSSISNPYDLLLSWSGFSVIGSGNCTGSFEINCCEKYNLLIPGYTLSPVQFNWAVFFCILRDFEIEPRTPGHSTERAAVGVSRRPSRPDRG